MESAGSSEKLLMHIYQTTWRHVPPKDKNLYLLNKSLLKTLRRA